MATKGFGEAFAEARDRRAEAQRVLQELTATVVKDLEADPNFVQLQRFLKERGINTEHLAGNLVSGTETLLEPPPLEVQEAFFDSLPPELREYRNGFKGTLRVELRGSQKAEEAGLRLGLRIVFPMVIFDPDYPGVIKVYVKVYDALEMLARTFANAAEAALSEYFGEVTVTYEVTQRAPTTHYSLARP